MALSETNEDRNVYDGVTAAGGNNLSEYPGLYLGDTEVADNTLDPASIGPNNPRPVEVKPTAFALNPVPD